MTTKTIHGDLILKKDFKFNGHLVVEGDIKGYFNINARNIDAWNINAWNINAWNINARNIDAWNINARNIDALNINAWNIDALNIDAWNIIYCEKLTKKKPEAIIKAKMLIENRSQLEKKEWKQGAGQ